MQFTLPIVLNVVFSVIGLIFLIWISVRTFRRTEDPAKLLFKWVFSVPFALGCLWVAGRTGPFGPFVIVVMAVTLSVVWTPHISELISRPIAGLFDGGNIPPEPKPFYSIALAKRKNNQPLEAIVHIRQQLAKFPDDYEGVALLAAVQAEDMKDLPSAEITLNRFCDRPDAPPKQVAAAFTQLADWHLKLMQDTDAARAMLEKIIARYPDTELSVQAAQRIAHLGGVGKILLDAHDRRPLAVPEGVKNVGLLDSSAFLVPKEAAPGQLAAAYVKHLEQHPLDAEIREKLATLYADHYHRLDLATIELKQLIEYPNQPAKRVAHWLNLLADLQVRLGADYDTVRHTLEIIIEQFPNTGVASQALSRLSRLKLEFKGKAETPGKPLGVYEQNIGLKYGPSGRST